MSFGVTAFLVFLVLWGFAWRYQLKFAFGVLIGLVLGAPLAQFIGPFSSVDEIPLWLPPMPFVLVVVTLFLYAFLAWWFLDVKAKEKN
jgi:ABC-type antimicrobial peptide transport system permease subunit